MFRRVDHVPRPQIDKVRYIHRSLLLAQSNSVKSKSIDGTYTMKAQKIRKPVSVKVEQILKKYLGCTGG